MLAAVDLPCFTNELRARAHTLAREFNSACGDIGTTLRLKAGENLLQNESRAYALVEDGILRFVYKDKVARIYDAGDVLLIGSLPRLGDCSITSPFGASLRVFDRDDLLSALVAEPERLGGWLEMTEIEVRLLHLISSIQSRDELEQEIDIREHPADEVILREGDRNLAIRELLEGHAIISASGIEVGVVNAGEVFGEISFLTGEASEITVTASEECIVQDVAMDRLEAAVQCRPHMMTTLAKNLAATICELREREAKRDKASEPNQK